MSAVYVQANVRYAQLLTATKVKVTNPEDDAENKGDKSRLVILPINPHPIKTEIEDSKHAADAESRG